MALSDKVKLAKTETTTGVEVVEGEVLSKEVDPVHKAIATDEYAGQGGCYLYDPATGKRTPVTE